MTIIYKQAQPNLNTTPKPVVTDHRDDWGYFQPVYDWDKLWPEILREIGNGASLTTAINKPGWPTYDAVQKHMRARPEIKRLYEEAVEIRADFLAESLIDISEAPIPSDLDGPQLSAWINLQNFALKLGATKSTSTSPTLKYPLSKLWSKPRLD